MVSDFKTRDEFQRRPLAEKLIKLLVEDISVSPMVIDGPWGSGKTEFTLKLISLFEAMHPNYNLIYIDAFKADHADNPLMTVLAEIIKNLPDSEKQSVIQKVIPAIRSLSKTVGKAATAWLLKQDAAEVVKDFESEIKEASDSLIDYSVEKLLTTHIEAEKDLSALQSLLTEIAKEKPIVLFIDELDRCRPDFSISILETIKHVFNVPNVQFVLITNHSQLLASVKHIYGDQLDAKRYLDKFLAFSFKLSATVGLNPHQIKLASEVHFTNLLQTSSVLNETVFNESEGKRIIDFGVDLIKSHNLSLREVETLVRYLEIYHTLSEGFSKDMIIGYGLLRLVGVFIYSFDEKFAKELEQGVVDAYSIERIFGKDEIIDIQQEKPSNVKQVIHAMFAMESNKHANVFNKLDKQTLQERTVLELKLKWDPFFESMLGGAFHYNSDEENLMHVKSAIRELMMISGN